MKKKITAILMLFVMLFTISGCKSNEDIGSILQKALENSQNASSVTSTNKITLGMSMGEESIDFTSSMDITLLGDKAKIDTTIDFGDNEYGLGPQTTQTYMANDGDKYYNYMNVGDTWYKEELDMSEFEKSMKGYDSEAYLDAIIQNEDNFSFTKVEEDGKKLYKLEGILTGDSLNTMLSSANVLTDLESLGIDSSLFSNLGDLNIVVYLDRETKNFYKLQLDMTEMMQQLMQKTMDSIASESGEAADDTDTINISKCTLDTVYTGFNNAEEFDIPKEALDAETFDMTNELNIPESDQ